MPSFSEMAQALLGIIMLAVALSPIFGVGFFLGWKRGHRKVEALEHALYEDGFAMRAAEIRLEWLMGNNDDVRDELLYRLKKNHELLDKPCPKNRNDTTSPLAM